MFRDIHHGKTCPYCRRTMDRGSVRLHPTRDHVIPRCRGGTEKIICCLTCNGLKADMLPEEWSAYMMANPGWWLLSRAERRARRRATLRQYDHPDKRGNIIRRRQGSPPMPPVIVPPELIFREVT